MSSKVERVSIRLDANMMLEIKELCVIYDASISSVIRILLIRSLKEIIIDN